MKSKMKSRAFVALFCVFFQSGLSLPAYANHYYYSPGYHHHHGDEALTSVAGLYAGMAAALSTTLAAHKEIQATDRVLDDAAQYLVLGKSQSALLHEAVSVVQAEYKKTMPADGELSFDEAVEILIDTLSE